MKTREQILKARLRAKNDAATALRKLIDWCLEEGMIESADLLADAASVTATIAKSLEARTKWLPPNSKNYTPT